MLVLPIHADHTAHRGVGEDHPTRAVQQHEGIGEKLEHFAHKRGERDPSYDGRHVGRLLGLASAPQRSDQGRNRSDEAQHEKRPQPRLPLPEDQATTEGKARQQRPEHAKRGGFKNAVHGIAVGRIPYYSQT